MNKPLMYAIICDDDTSLYYNKAKERSKMSTKKRISTIKRVKTTTKA